MRKPATYPRRCSGWASSWGRRMRGQCWGGPASACRRWRAGWRRTPASCWRGPDVRRMRSDWIWPEASASSSGAELVQRWEALLDKSPRLRPWVDRMLGRERMRLQESGIAQVEVERILWQDLSRWLFDFEALPAFAVSAIAVTLEDETLHQVQADAGSDAPAPPESPERAVAELETLVADPAFALAFHCVDVRLRPALPAGPDLATVPEADWFALLHAGARQTPVLTAQVAITLVLRVLSSGWARHPASVRHAGLRLFLAGPADLRGDLQRLCGSLPAHWALLPAHLPAFVEAARAARAALADASGLCARFVAAAKDRPGGLALLADGSAALPSPEELAELFRNVRKYDHMRGFRQLLSLL